MMTTLFSEELLQLLPLHFRYLNRSPVAQVAELSLGVRFSSSYRHQSACYRQQELHKPVSEIDYVSLMDFARQYTPPVLPPAEESPLAR